MRWPRLFTLAGSTAAHAGAGALVALVAGAGAGSVIVVDLSHVSSESLEEGQPPPAPEPRTPPPAKHAAPPRPRSAAPVRAPAEAENASRSPSAPLRATVPLAPPAILPADPAPQASATAPSASTDQRRAAEARAAPPGLPVAPPATPPGPPASTADVHPVPDQPLAAVKAPAPAPESRLPAPAMATSSSVATGARAAPSPGSVGPPDAAADRGRASGSPPRQSADSGAASSSAGDGAATSGPGPLASAAVPSGDGRPGADYGAYYASFRKRVQEAAGYPVSARRRGISGTVEIEVLIDPTGAVRNVKLVASSSHAVLDDAALEAVRSVSPMPLPEHLPRRPFVFVLPVSFQLR